MTAARRVYLVSTTEGTPAERSARCTPIIEVLTERGFSVTAPAASAQVSESSFSDTHASTVEAIANLQTADCVVTMPGAEAAWESNLAAALGLKVFSLGDALDALSA